MPVRRALLWLLLLCPLWPTLVFSLVPLPAIYLQTDPVTSALWFALIGFGTRLLLPLFRRERVWQLLDGGIALMMLYLAAGLLRQAQQVLLV